jgi:hypothetical protein
MSDYINEVPVGPNKQVDYTPRAGQGTVEHMAGGDSYTHSLRYTTKELETAAKEASK